MKSDLDLEPEDVRQEHLADVDARAHVLYMVGVLGGAALLMLFILLVIEVLS